MVWEFCVKNKRKEAARAAGWFSAGFCAESAAWRFFMSEIDAKKRKKWGIACLAAVIAFMGIIFFFVGRPMLSFVSEPNKFRLWVEGNGVWGKIAFVLMMAFQVVIAIIPGEPLEIGAGYAFGSIWGTVLCLAGTWIGGTVVFFVVKKWGMKIVSFFFSEEKLRSFKFLKNERRLHVLAFILFLIPGTPKDILTYVFAMTPISYPRWILITAVARLPSVVTSTIGGNALGMQDYQFAVIVFAMTLVISAAGLFIYNRILKVRKKKAMKASQMETSPESETGKRNKEASVKSCKGGSMRALRARNE